MSVTRLLIGGQQSGRFITPQDRYVLPRFMRKRPLGTTSVEVPRMEDMVAEIDEYTPYRVQAIDQRLPENSARQPEPLYLGVLTGLDFNERLASVARAERTLLQLEGYFGKDYFQDLLQCAKRDFPL